jgi:HEPN domain-containing protein
VLEAFVELCAVMRVADEFYWNGAQSFGELAAKALEEQVPAASKSAAFQGHKSADHAIKATFMSKMKQAMTHARLREMFEVTGTRVSFAPGGEATIEVSEAYRQKGEEAVAAWHKFTKDVGIHTPVKLVVREGN